MIDTNMEDSKQKRLLLAVTLGELGGAHKYIKDIATGLKNSYQITVSCGEKDAPLTIWAEKAGLNTAPLPSFGRDLWLGFLPTASDFKTFFALYRMFRNNKYDIVHLNSSKMGLVGAISAKLAATPKVVFTAHGWVFNEPAEIQPKRWLWVWVSKLAALFQNKIITVSNYDLDTAIKHRIAPARKLTAIYNGVSTGAVIYLTRQKARERLKEKVKIEENTTVLGTIANFYKTKDLETMIEALSLLENKNTILVVFGEGPERQNLESRIKDLELEDRVFLLGRVPGAAKYLRALDVYLMSSVKEGVPYTVLEAMAAKVPIVSTKSGGLRDILLSDPKRPGALIFETGNADDMARKIDYILTEKEDAEIIASNASYNLKKDFDLAKMIEKTRWVYEL